MPKRRTHPPEFKAQVALDALRSKKTLAELAASYELHPVQVCQWRQQALKRLPDLFRQVDHEDADQPADRLSQRLARLEQANADLMTEVQWLKKKFSNYDQLILRSLLEPDHPCISLRRQCKLIGVVRSSYYYRPAMILRHPPRLAQLIDQFCTLDPRISDRCLLSRLNSHGFTLCKTTLHRLLCRLGFAPFERKLIKLLEARLLQMPPLPVRGEGFDRDGEQWILDVAYWPSPQGTLFASLLVDAGSHSCLAWGLSDRLSPALVTHMLRGAMDTHPLPLLLRCETVLPYVSSACLSALTRAGVSVVSPLWLRSPQGSGRATVLAPLWSGLKQAAEPLRSAAAPRSEASILEHVIREANQRLARERDSRQGWLPLGLEPARTPWAVINDGRPASEEAAGQARSFLTRNIPFSSRRRPEPSERQSMG
jgi:transposase-like protein